MLVSDSQFHQEEEAGVAPGAVRVEARRQGGRVAGQGAAHQRHAVHEHGPQRHQVPVRRQVSQAETEPADRGRSGQTQPTCRPGQVRSDADDLPNGGGSRSGQMDIEPGDQGQNKSNGGPGLDQVRQHTSQLAGARSGSS